MLLDLLILQAIQQFKQERSLSATMHLLKGRVSIQTKQDAQLFDLTNLFHTVPFLTEGIFQKRIRSLEKRQFLKQTLKEQHTTAFVCTQGKTFLNRWSNTPLRYFQSDQLREERAVFLNRVYLFAQVLSYTGHNDYAFIPVVDSFSVQQWFKQVYSEIKGSEQDYLIYFYQELKRLLQQLTNDEAHLFVDRLSGKSSVGLSISQLAKTYNQSQEDIEITLLAISDKFLTIIEKEKEAYPVFRKIIGKTSIQQQMSLSTRKTLQMIHSGHDLETISNLRNLKLSTIHDHIVEIALMDPSFSISPYISAKMQDRILSIVQKHQTKRLKEIKNYLQQEIPETEVTYFQIRLTLSRFDS